MSRKHSDSSPHHRNLWRRFFIVPSYFFDWCNMKASMPNEKGHYFLTASKNDPFIQRMVGILNSISMLQSDIFKSSFILSALWMDQLDIFKSSFIWILKVSMLQSDRSIHKRFIWILKETLKKEFIVTTMDQIVGIIIWKINLESFTDIMNIYKMIPSEYFEESIIEKKRCNFSIQTWTLIFLWRKSQSRSWYQLKGFDFIQYFYYFSIWLWNWQHQISRWKGLKK